MPERLRALCVTLRQRSQAPAWTFTGLALFVALLAAIAVPAVTREPRMRHHLKNPEVGDVYEIKYGKGFSMLKVTEVFVSGAVQVARSTTSVEYASEVDGLRALPFSGDVFELTAQQRLEQFENKTLLRVVRH